VYFPPCFLKDEEIRYPVLYMIHGQTFNDDQWERLGIGPAADALINAKEAPPFLIVMPLERNTYSDIYLSGFSRDVTDGLVSWIDKIYPTCAERACRAIGGLSRGGAWAMRLGFTRWELFSAIGMHSTPPFSGDPGQFPIWLREIPPDQLPRVWMDAGDRDAWFQYSSAFEAQLTQYHVAHEWHVIPKGMHEESYWAEHVAEYLAWYTSPWKDLPQIRSLN
jgi:enterochelin esterase-like enzyme